MKEDKSEEKSKGIGRKNNNRTACGRREAMCDQMKEKKEKSSNFIRFFLLPHTLFHPVPKIR